MTDDEKLEQPMQKVPGNPEYRVPKDVLARDSSLAEGDAERFAAARNLGEMLRSPEARTPAVQRMTERLEALAGNKSKPGAYLAELGRTNAARRIEEIDAALPVLQRRIAALNELHAAAVAERALIAPLAAQNGARVHEVGSEDLGAQRASQGVPRWRVASGSEGQEVPQLSTPRLVALVLDGASHVRYFSRLAVKRIG
jgi:hypothetical protein